MSVQPIEPWGDPPPEPLYRHFLLLDDSTHFHIAIAKERIEDADRSAPIDLPDEVAGPFLDNLMARDRAFANNPFGGQCWQGWSISEAEWRRLARLAALADGVREFNRLVAYTV